MKFTWNVWHDTGESWVSTDLDPPDVTIDAETINDAAIEAYNRLVSISACEMSGCKLIINRVNEPLYWLVAIATQPVVTELHTTTLVALCEDENIGTNEPTLAVTRPLGASRCGMRSACTEPRTWSASERSDCGWMSCQ